MRISPKIVPCACCGKAIRMPREESPKGPIYCVRCGAAIFLGAPR